MEYECVKKKCYTRVRKEMKFTVEIIDSSTPSSIDVSEVFTCHMFYGSKEKETCLCPKVKMERDETFQNNTVFNLVRDHNPADFCVHWTT